MKNKLNNTGRDVNKKILIFLTLTAFLFLIYIFRLVKLQLFDPDSYKKKAEERISVKEHKSPPRGVIYDRNKIALATNLETNTAYIYEAITDNEKEIFKQKLEELNKSGSKNRELIESYEKKLDLPSYSLDEVENLSQLLGINSSKVVNMLKKSISGPIAYRVSDESRKKIEALKLPYVGFEIENERSYVAGEVGASVLGFSGSDSGSYGLEKEYDSLLSGKPSFLQYYKARGGTKLPFQPEINKKGKDPYDLVTNLDYEFQKIVYNNLVGVFKKEKPLYATAIVSNPNTGEILAMESLPSFDPNQPRELKGDIDKMFLEVLEKDKIESYMMQRWNNLAISSIYEPGSTFKGITSAIALDSNREIETHNKYVCKGKVEIAPGVFIRCWRHNHPHGIQTIKEAFSNSCNPAFVGIIDDIGKEKFVEYGKNFKFGSLTGIDLPNENKGIFPKDSNIKDVDFRPMSYGHSVSVTPLQELMALNATINGGKYYRPHLLNSIIDKSGNIVKKIEKEEVARVISESSSKTMREFFENNSNNSGYYKENPLRIGHKTGTTEVVKTSNIFDKNPKDKNGNSIISIYANYPANQPKYSMIIVVAFPQNMEFASNLNPTVKNIFNSIEEVEFLRKGAAVKDSELVKIDNLVGMPIYKAKTLLAEKGLELEYDKKNISSYEIITSQLPEADGYIKKGSKIKVSTSEDGKIVVPNASEMNFTKAKALLEENHLRVVKKGQGERVVRQEPKAGTLVNKRNKIILYTVDIK